MWGATDTVCMFCVSPAARVTIVAAVMGVITCSSAIASDHPHGTAQFRNAVVATDHPAASDIGAGILRRGGNVVDAAVATSFALSVVRPASCGIGGGGFMLIWDAQAQQAIALDYRERAPAAATHNMFSSIGGTDTHSEQPSIRSGLAVAVPGTVAGLCYAAENYGSFPLRFLIEPAIRLAREGFFVDEHDIRFQQKILKTLARHPEYRQRFEQLFQEYLNAGHRWNAGDRFHSPQVTVLEKIAREGSAAFYTGPVAAAIVEATARHGGLITRNDLASTTPVVRMPVEGRFRDTRVFSMPPPSSGGIALIQTLQSLEQWESLSDQTLRELEHNSVDYIHVVTEALKHAFADRAEFLGDTDFVQVPVERLLSKRYAEQIAARIRPEQVRQPQDYGRFFTPDDSGTSHFSVIDRNGNAVACTETINLAYGSFIVVPEYGIILNNEMDDFAAQPGKPNAFGLIQSDANAIEAGKKPLSSMSPMIVVRDSRAVFASGASGGPRIISATLQATLNHLVHGMTPEQSVTAPRFHHQWFPEVLRLEPEFGSEIRRKLRQRGHATELLTKPGANQSVARSQTGVFGGSDPRKLGRPAGH